MVTWIINVFLSLFFLIDMIVYGLIESLYKIIMQISNLAVISQASMQAFAERIYVLVGVVMLFKVAFSLIQYFANPDKINDAQAGAAGLVKRIITALVLLVVTPTIFQLAFRIQGTVLKSQILEKVILNATATSDNEDTIEIDCDLEKNRTSRACSGRTIAFAIFRGFVTEDKELAEKEYSKAKEQYNEAVKSQNLNKLLDPILAGSVGDRPYNYSFIVSTIAGGFAAWILFMFCFDVAIRAARITFLQLLAPIPILSYIDEQKGKAVFKNWLNDCVSTYLEVFVKLISLYFVVYIIAEISKDGLFSFYEYTTEGATKQATDVGLLATAFIVLGLLMFANQAPKWIMEMFNIKGSGNFTMNPLKKIGQSPLATAAVGTTALGLGAAGRMLQNSNKKRKMQEKLNKGETLSDSEQRALRRATGMRGFAGVAAAGFGAFARAEIGAMKGDGKNNVFAPTNQAAKKTAQTHDRHESLRDQNKNPYVETSREKLYNYFNVKNEYGGIGELNESIKKMNNAINDLAGLEHRAREKETDELMSYISKYNNFTDPGENLAELMHKAFERDDKGRFVTDASDRENIKIKIQNNMTAQGVDQSAINEMLTSFDTFKSHEETHNYYNQEHEKMKKELGKMKAAAAAEKK